MKNYFSAVGKLVAAIVCALSLGSCSRADYAMLPKGASYHGVARATTSVPVATSATPAVAEVPAAPVAAVAVAQPTPATAPAAEAIAATPAKGSIASTTVATTAPAPKMSLVQRLAVNKLTHKMDKLVQKSGAMRTHDNAASTAKGSINGNLRIGLILLLIGVLVGLIPHLGLVGTIIAIIGIVFIVLWLLDQL